MLRKLMVVGVGGSGGKTLWVLRDELERAARERGWPSKMGFPECWQFLHIDTPKVVAEASADFPPPLPNDLYLGLARPGVEYRELDEILCREDAARKSMAGWRPDDPLSVNIPLQLGAGQYRAIGAMTAQYAVAEIASAISERASVLANPTAEAHLTKINEVFNAASSGGGSTAPIAIVVGSVAGGSGSGLFLDVCDILRLALKSEQRGKIYGILYAPDAFGGLLEDAKGVHGNALAAMAELTAATVNRGEPTDDDVSLLKRGNLSEADRLVRRGPDFPFLVGRSNANVEFADPAQVFKSVGRAISVWVTDEDVQNQLATDLTGNWEANTDRNPYDQTRLSPNIKGVLSSFGSASVGLARDRFADYAADRLSAATVDRLLEQHRAEGDAMTDSDRENFESKVADALMRFKDVTHLWEQGDQFSDIQNALFDKDAQRGVLDRILGAVLAQIDETQLATLGPRLPSIVDDATRPHEAIFERDELNRLDQASKHWVETVQDDLVRATTDVIARHGLRVAKTVIDRMIEELQLVVEEEFKPEAARRASSTRTLVEAFKSPAGMHAVSRPEVPVVPQSGQAKGRRGASTKTPPPAVRPMHVSSFRDRIRRALDEVWGRSAERRVYERASMLVSDLIENLLKPLSREILRQEEDLRTSCRGTPEQPSVIDAWRGAARAVPKRLQPAQNELLLEDLDLFPSVYAQQLQLETGESDVSSAESETIMRLFLRGEGDLMESTEPALLEYQQRWAPRQSERFMGKPGQGAKFLFRSDLDAVHQRASAWVNTPGTRVGDYVRTSLSDYLRGEGLSKTEVQARITLFRDRFRQVFALSAPLARLSPTGMSLVHGLKADSAERESVISRLPLADGHPAREAAEEVLKEQGYKTTLETRFGEENPRQSIEVATFFKSAYNPFVFTSLVGPIEATVKQLRLVGSFGDLWKWRRARQLPRAILLDPTYRRAMVRGWWIARLMGHVRGVSVDGAYKREAVGVWTGESWSSMPYPLLGRPREMPEVLPALLESLPIAIIDAVTVNSLEPIAAYRRLLYLGGLLDDETRADDDPELPREFLEWLKTGEFPSGLPTGERIIDSPDRTSRISDAADYIDTVRKYFAENRFPDIERNLTGTVPPDWELRHDILGVLHSLGNRCRTVDAADKKTFG